MSPKAPSLRRMTIELALARTLPTAPTSARAFGVGVFADRLEGGDVPAALDRAFLDAQGFTGKPGQTCVVPGEDSGVMVAVGLGEEDDATVATYRRAPGARRQSHVATDLLDGAPERLDRAAVAQAIAEGIVLGAYRYTALKSEPEPNRIASLLVVGKGGKRVTAALERGRTIAEAVCLARDLVNQPGGTLTPTAFAERAEQLAVAGRFSAGVLHRGGDGEGGARGRAASEEEGLGGLLGVNRGSDEEPRFVKLSWEPERARATVALVGKGITFDSGGLSLKTTEPVVGMTGEMG